MELGTTSCGGGVSMPQNIPGLQSSFCVIWLLVRFKAVFPLIWCWYGGSKLQQQHKISI
jgi:hypothetical protein